MKPSDQAYKLIKSFEGCKLKAYKDSASVWTIGYGTTYYPDGASVKEHDSITIDRADFLLRWQVLTKSGEVDELVNGPLDKLKHNYSRVNQNQFDALVSFAYNVGTGALKKSSLLKKVLANPNDPTIENSFLQWNKARVKGVLTPLLGLTKRRQAEADLYFT